MSTDTSGTMQRGDTTKTSRAVPSTPDDTQYAHSHLLSGKKYESKPRSNHPESDSGYYDSLESFVLSFLVLISIVVTVSIPWFVLFERDPDEILQPFSWHLHADGVRIPANAGLLLDPNFAETRNDEDHSKVRVPADVSTRHRIRTIRLRDYFSESLWVLDVGRTLWVHDIARCPRTNHLYATAMTRTERLLIRLDSLTRPELLYKLDAKPECNLYASVNDLGEIMITSPSDRTGLLNFFDGEGRKTRQLHNVRPAFAGGFHDRANRLYYICQPFEQQIAVLNSNASYVTIIGKNVLHHPLFLVEGDDRLYVSDMKAKAVFVFAKTSGILLDTIRVARGTTEIVPRGLSYDKRRKLLYVADRQNNCLHVYVARGDRRHEWLDTIHGLEKPVGVTSLVTGEIVVASEFTDALHVISFYDSGVTTSAKR